MIKDKLINECQHPLLARLVIDTMFRLEEGDRLGTHKRLSTALKRKSYKKLAPVVNNCIDESLHGIVAEEYQTLSEKALQSQMKNYLHSGNYDYSDIIKEN